MLGGLTSMRGMLGAGIAGFGASQAIGAAMNVSPKFANAMFDLQDQAVEGLIKAFMVLEPHILEFANSLPALIENLALAASSAMNFYKELQDYSSGIGSAVGKASAGDFAGAERSLIAAGLGATNAIGITDVSGDAAQAFADGNGSALGRAIMAAARASIAGGQARRQNDPARTADPRP